MNDGSRKDGNDPRWASKGIGDLTPEQGLEALGQVLELDEPQVGVLNVDWEQFLASFPAGQSPSVFSAIKPAARGSGARPAGKGSELRQQLSDQHPSRRREVLLSHVHDTVRRVIGRDPSETLDSRQALMDLGMDSLMSIELRNALGASAGRTLPATLAFDYPSIERLAEYFEREVFGELFVKEGGGGKVKSKSRGKGSEEPIAIIGMACRYPGGANDPERYWKLLKAGGSGNREIPTERWDHELYYDADPGVPGKSYVKRANVLDVRIDQFDTGLFGLSAVETEWIDPQQRLLLEVVWEALENACVGPDGLRGSDAGVYVGLSTYDYVEHVHRDLERVNAYTNIGCAVSAAAGRVSYLFGLQGPCVALDTACSSSLVAVHLGCQALRNGECGMVLAGGTSLLISPESTIGFCKLAVLSPDGTSKTFDAGANGYGRGEGCGVVVLKRLSDALADGDRVLAVVRGTCVNQDGPSSALTAPNGPSQQAVVRRALETGRLEASAVQYVECHGTGTKLGDPIEVQSLGAVFTGKGEGSGRLAIGSVKANVGHLEPAAGMAAMMKVVLGLEHEELPPHVGLKELNPMIPLEELPLVIPGVRTPWLSGEGKRVAGVSGFAFQGTNAHVILEEAPSRGAEKREAERPGHVLLLTGKTEGALGELVTSYERHLGGEVEGSLGDICHSANTGRARLEQRVAVRASSVGELRQKLGWASRGEDPPGLWRGETKGRSAPRVGFVFTPRGGELWGVGRELYGSQPEFRRAMEECGRIAERHLKRLLFEVMWGEERKLLERSEYGDAAVFALEHSLAKLWRGWGVEPAVVMGEGVGEYVAACVAGVMSVEDALKVVVERGRVLDEAAGQGSMGVVFATEGEVERALREEEGRATIAAVHGEGEVVISGSKEGVRSVLQRLRSEGARVKTLGVAWGLGSREMEGVAEKVSALFSGVKLSPPHLRVVSGVSGKEVGQELSEPSYWRGQLTERRRPVEAMAAMRGLGAGVLLEVGAEPLLLELERRSRGGEVLEGLASLRRGHGEWEQLLEGVGQLSVQGVEIDWQRFDEPYGLRKVALPTYPFQRRRHWVEGAERRSLGEGEQRRGAEGPAHELLGRRVEGAIPIFEAVWRKDSPIYMQEHRLYGAVVATAAAYIDAAMEAATQVYGPGPKRLEEVVVKEALILPEDEGRTVQVVLMPESPSSATFQILSLAGDDAGPARLWVQHASGRIIAGEQEPAPRLDAAALRAQVQSRCTEVVTGEDYYRNTGPEIGVEMGPRFHGTRKIWRREGELLLELQLPALLSEEAGSYLIHPSFLDNAFQVFGGAVATSAWRRGQRDPYVPVGFDRMRFCGPTPERLWCHVTLSQGEDGRQDLLRGDITMFDEAGAVVVEIRGYRAKRAPREALLRLRPEASKDWFYEVKWQSQEGPGESSAQGSWLVLCDRGGVGDRLAEELEAHGGRCVRVKEGAGYEALGEGRYGVRPRERADLERLWSELGASGQRPLRGVVHCWGLDVTGVEQTSAATLWADEARAYGSALTLVQQLVSSEGAQAGLCLVTAGGQATGSEPVSVGQAPLWGLGRAVALEYPKLRCLRVDLEGARPRESVPALGRELCGASPEEEIAFREGQRLVRRLSSAKVASEGPWSARPDGTYVISGGLGGIGLSVAERLVERGARQLVLLGRSRGGESARERVSKLEEAGASVMVAELDVSESEAVRALWSRMGESLPPVRGVVHAAGVLEDGMVAEQSWEKTERVFGPKVMGGWNLHEATRGAALDFFVLFSSQVSVWGNPGQSSYVAANCFLDALAHQRRAQGLAGLSINWGPWSGVGMAAELAEREAGRWSAMGMEAIPPGGGVEAFERLLVGSSAQVGVHRVRWPAFVQGFLGGRELPLLEQVSRSGKRGGGKKKEGVEGTELVRRLAGLKAAERREELVAHTRDLVVRLLGLESSRVEVKQPLMEMGMDSVLAVELRGTLGRGLGRTLPPTLAFDYPSIEAIAGYLEKELFAEEEEERATIEVSEVGVEVNEPIAIIGMACRFPGDAWSPEEYWRVLREGRDAIVEIPRERWDVERFFHADPDAPGRMYSRWGGFLREVATFDAPFFGISPLEAEGMDPQQRMLLETSWEALEHAGHAPEKLAGSEVGVFVGIGGIDYQLMRARVNDLSRINAYSGTGSSLSVAAGRISYVMGLNGPSVAIDTACSTSLVAVHYACQSLRLRECQMALAGGVNLILEPETTVAFSKTKLLAPDGRCKTFDAGANGYVRGEGCGVVVLKRLSAALADRDNILGVVRGTAVNQDGASSTLTAPNGPAQQAVIRRALASAKLDAAQISYVECHGTGTALGDPIEVQSLGSVFGKSREVDGRIPIASVKTNVGHLEVAAGMASLIKVTLALQHEEIPPHLHLKEANPFLSLDSSPVVIPTERMAWPRSDRRGRAAGISGFAFQGTNAHLVVGEAPVQERAARPVERPSHLLTLSAKNEPALRELARRYEARLQSAAEEELGDICFTANAGRNHFAHRLAVVGRSSAELGQRLSGFAEGEVLAGVELGEAAGPARRVAFLFGGAERGYREMGRALYESAPVFRQVIEECEELARGRWGLSVVELLGGASAGFEGRGRALAVLCVEHAMSELWRSFGLRPTVVMGSGVGELGAACSAGVMSLGDAMRLVMEQEEGESAPEVELKRPEVTIVSSESGQDLGAAVCEAAYWSGRRSGAPESLSPAMEKLRGMGVEVFLEVGPGGAMVGSGRAASSGEGLWLSSLERGADEWSHLLRSLGSLYVRGLAVDWEGLDQGYQRRRVALPTYPFQRKRYWLEGAQGAIERGARAPEDHGSTFPGRRVVGSGLHVFESLWTPKRPSWIADHGVHGMIVVPGAGHIDLAVEAAKAAMGGAAVRLEEVLFQEPLVFLAEEEQRRVQVILMPSGLGGLDFQIVSQGPEQEEWTRHASGQVRREEKTAGEQVPTLRELQQRCAKPVDSAEFYKALGKLGFDYRGSFRSIEKVWTGEREALALIACPASLTEELRQYDFHPGFLDSCFQLGLVLRDEIWGNEGVPYIPVGVDGVQLRKRIGSRLWCHFVLHKDETAKGDYLIYDEGGELVATVRGFQAQRATRAALLRAMRKGPREWVYEEEWEKAEAKSGGGDHSGKWMIFADRGGVGQELAARLEALGGRCWLAWSGKEPSRLGDRRFQVVGASGDGLDPVLSEIGGAPGTWRGVVHLWSLDAAPADASTLETLRADQTAACGSVLRLVQGLAKGRWTPAMWIVTRGAVSVRGVGASAISPAVLWGMGRTLDLEHPELSCRLVDLDPNGTGGVDQVWSEMGTAGEGETGYRDGARHVRRLVRWRGERRSAGGVEFRGAYLLTGGLGALSLILARRLVERGVRGLVLLELRAASPEAKQRIQELEQLGATVRVVEGDVTQKADVARAIATAESLGGLRGVVHTAGRVDDATLVDQDVERFEQVIWPKVAGAWNLHEQTRGMKLDAFVLYASQAGLMGNRGQASYAAANAYLDSLAHYRRGQGLPGLSVDWGPWAEVGMSAALGDRGERQFSSMGIGMLPPDRGVELLETVLEHGLVQAGVMVVDWRRLTEGLFQGRVRPLLSRLEQKGAGQEPDRQTALLRALEEARPESRLEVLGAHVTRAVRTAIGLEPDQAVDSRTPLMDLGMDSLMAVELRNQLCRSVGRSLPATLAFNYPTVDAIAGYLAGLLSIDVTGDATPPTPEQQKDGQEVAEVAQLSDDQARDLLAAALEGSE